MWNRACTGIKHSSRSLNLRRGWRRRSESSRSEKARNREFGRKISLSLKLPIWSRRVMKIGRDERRRLKLVTPSMHSLPNTINLSSDDLYSSRMNMNGILCLKRSKISSTECDGRRSMPGGSVKGWRQESLLRWTETYPSWRRNQHLWDHENRHS